MKNLRVLLVDDNERFLDSIERYLNSIPEMNIVCAAKATSGEQAIKLCAELNLDLILMDITLPGMNGLDAMRSIKQTPNAPRVIILTIHDSSEYRWAAKEAGADGFLVKSEFTEKLVPLVQSLFPQSSDCPSSEDQAIIEEDAALLRHKIEKLNP
jgi:DNA-binding NarL/FixJ family response regulator